jgi:hypothetical protein
MKGKPNMKKNLLDLDLQHFAEEEVADAEVSEAVEPTEEPEAEETETVEENGNDEPQEQSAEENARYAAIRRRAEEDAKRKYEAEMEQKNKRIAAICQGLTHPVTGQPITNVDEYFDALQEQQRIQRERELEDKGIDPKIIDQAIQSSPIVMQANMYMEQVKEQQQLAQIQRDVEEISKLDPSIKNAEDLYNAPYTPALIKFCQDHGTTLTEAFKIINYDNHLVSRDNAARQQAINQMRGKDHLASQPNGVSTDNDDVEVPAEIMRSMKAEGKTEKQIRELFKLTVKNGLNLN